VINWEEEIAILVCGLIMALPIAYVLWIFL
jgi:hypothetical protein